MQQRFVTGSWPLFGKKSALEGEPSSPVKSSSLASNFVLPAFHACGIAIIALLAGCATTSMRQPAAEFDLSSTLDKGPDAIPPVPVRTVAPEHPQWLLRDGVQGIAWLSCRIDENGRVDEVVALNASRIEFADAAIAAVKQWTFIPATRAGRPVAVRVVFPLNFELNPRDSSVNDAARSLE